MIHSYWNFLKPHFIKDYKDYVVPIYVKSGKNYDDAFSGSILEFDFSHFLLDPGLLDRNRCHKVTFVFST